MSNSNKQLDFAWRYTDDPNTYVYRREGWMYILFRLLLRRPLPPLRVINKKIFPDKVKEVEKNKGNAQVQIGFLLAFLSIPVCAHFNTSIITFSYIIFLCIGIPCWIPDIAVFIFKRLERLREKIKRSNSHTST